VGQPNNLSIDLECEFILSQATTCITFSSWFAVRSIREVFKVLTQTLCQSNIVVEVQELTHVGVRATTEKLLKANIKPEPSQQQCSHPEENALTFSWLRTKRGRN
jgi:hypothetical protein